LGHEKVSQLRSPAVKYTMNKFANRKVFANYATHIEAIKDLNSKVMMRPQTK
jgi:hypothetical protein